MSFKNYHLGQYVSKKNGYIFLENSSVQSPGSVQDLDLQQASTEGTLEGVSSGISGANFHDAFIDLSQTPLETDKSYYLSLRLPQDMSYDYTVEIQLVYSKTDLEGYQFVKKITVPNGGNIGSTSKHNICLYNYDSSNMVQDVRVGFVHPFSQFVNLSTSKQKLAWIKGLQGGHDVISYVEPGQNASQVAYYRLPPNILSTYTDNALLDFFSSQKWKTKENNVSAYAANCTLMETWHGSLGSGAFLYAEMCFTPLANYKGIRLKIQRSAEDYNYREIVAGKDTGSPSIQYGRVIQFSQLRYDLYSVRELIGNQVNSPIPIGKDQQIKSISIQGHPGMLFLVNDADLRIGASGMYELHDIITIKSFKVVKHDDTEEGLRDHFIVNYQYADIEGEEV